jgi:hypothetical protein
MISSEGLMKAWPGMDTPGWLGRDLGLFPTVLKTVRESSAVVASFRTETVEILCPIDFSLGIDATQNSAFDAFLDDVFKQTGIQHRKISIKDDWRTSPPVDEKDLDIYLKEVGII